ncbi:MAG: type II toxin-antitoxin system VapC family toxin [Candidatus Heimdallarchaeota archaeon]
MVDTSILVDILRKKPKTIEYINGLGSTPLFSTEISVMELIFGVTGSSFYLNNPEMKQRRLSEIDELCSRFVVLSFNHKAAVKTAEILGSLKLEGQLIDFRHAMIAGIAQSNGISELLTSNLRHFERIPEFQVGNII